MDLVRFLGGRFVMHLIIRRERFSYDTLGLLRWSMIKMRRRFVFGNNENMRRWCLSNPLYEKEGAFGNR